MISIEILIKKRQLLLYQPSNNIEVSLEMIHIRIWIYSNNKSKKRKKWNNSIYFVLNIGLPKSGP